MAAYKFLSEQPTKKELRFGHKELITTLKSIVTECIAPFTIGLYGKWGSGKSSIAESLQNELHGSGIPVILFDVWKHEGDALRRTFLKELVRQLHGETYGRHFFKKDFALDERIDGSLEKTHLSRVFLDLRTLLPFLKQFAFLGLIVIVILFLVGVLIDKFFPDFSSVYKMTFITNYVSITFILSLISWVFNNLKDFVSKSEVSVSYERVTDPHDFENEFQRVLNNLSNRRIVIVFDNLDRVSGENAIEIISTIKTFLEPADRANKNKEVVFLIPCDVEAIKKHLQKALKDQVLDGQLGSYSEEFLKKFFNTILWVPEFYAIELEHFALEKLKETGISEFDNEHLSWLIVQVFQQNPRQIIQFINILIANYLLLERKSLENSFGDKEFHKNNVPQLAKYLLLIQKFPEIMDEFKATKTYDLNTDLSTEAAFKRFRDDTVDIVIHSLEPFFNFKISDQERAIPGISRLFQMLENGNVQDAIKYSEELKIRTNHVGFGKTFSSYLLPRNNIISICIILNGLFEITRKLEINLDGNTYRNIQKKLETYSLSSLDRVLPSLLTSEFLEKGHEFLNNKTKQNVLDRWINILKERQNSASHNITRAFELDLVKNIVLYQGNITNQSKLLLHQVIINYINDSEILKLLITSTNQTIFISDNLAQQLLNSIGGSFNSIIDQFTEKIELLELIGQPIIETVDKTMVLQKLAEILNHLNNTTSESDRATIFGGFKKLVNRYSEQIASSQTDTAGFSTFFSALDQAYERSKWKTSHLLIPTMAEIEQLNSHFTKVSSRALREFFSNSSSIDFEYVEYVFNNLAGIAAILEKPEYKGNIESSIFNSPKIFLLFYKHASVGKRMQWLKKLIEDSNSNIAKNLYDELNKIGLPDAQGIFETLVKQMRRTDSLQKFSELNAVLNALDFGKYQVSTNSLVNLIVAFINERRYPDQVLQLFASAKILSNEDHLKIIGQVLTGLKSSPGNSIGLKLVSSHFKLLSKDGQEEFIDLVIENLIIRENDGDKIVEGFKLLGEVEAQLGVQKIKLEKIRIMTKDLKDTNPTKHMMLSKGLALLGII